MLNDKELYILEKLVSKKEVSIENISKKYKISERTVRYYINNINLILKHINVKKIDIKEKILYLREDVNFVKLKKILNSLNFISKENRILSLLLKLIISESKFNISNISKKLNVSRVTIKKDILDIEKILKDFKISLEYSPLKGYYIEGEEDKIILFKIETLEKIYNKILDENGETKNTREFLKNELFKYIDDHFFNKIKEFLIEIQKEISLNIMDKIYSKVVIYFILIIKFESNSLKKEKIDYSSIIQFTKEYKIIKKIYNNIFNNETNENEVNVILKITNIIIALSINKIDNTNFLNWTDETLFIKRMISKISKILEIDLTKDKLLYDCLDYHIRPSIYRIKEGINISEISNIYNKKENIINFNNLNENKIFSAIKFGIKEIEDIFELKFTNDELILLEFHFRAAIERNKKTMTKRVILVCELGYGSSRILEHTLKSKYDVSVIDILPAHMLNYNIIDADDIDYILTTVDLKSNQDVPIIKISYLLTKEDENSLLKWGFSYKQNTIQLSKLLQLISENYNDREQMINQLIYNFSNVINNDLEYKKVSELDKYLKPNNVKFIDKKMTWEEVIKFSGDILKENNAIKNEYIDSMIDLVKTIGSYIVLENGVAIPHGDPKYAKKVDVVLVISKYPIYFSDNKYANIFFTFSTTDANSHLDMMNSLFDLLTVENLVEKFLSCNSYEEIKKYFFTIDKGGK